ncbi:MAG TPA: hypothetical protein VGE21_08145 [Flavobacteriales bacterium]
MDRERLNHLMQDPSAVQRQDIADLKAMTERYPWFSGAHLLLAVGDHATGDVLFDEQLRTTAAHLPSRAVLFDLVHRETQEAAPARMAVAPPEPLPSASAPAASLSVQDVPSVVVAEEPGLPVLPPPPFEVESPAQLVLVRPSAVVEEAPIIEEKVEEAVPEVVQPVIAEEEEQVPEIDVVDPVEEEEEEVQAIPEEDPLDKQIRNAALAGGYALVLEHAPLPPAVPEAVPVSAPPTPSKPASKPAPVRRERMRFTDWLQVPEEGAVENAATPPPVVTLVLPTVPAPVATHPAPPPRAQGDMAPGAAPVASPSDTKSLIERFIQQSVQTAPAKKAEFYTPQLAAKRSLEDHSDLVSETLAKVYEAQGNYTKALAAYQRLALKHPDKSTYFAALSKAVEAKMSK